MKTYLEEQKSYLNNPEFFDEISLWSAPFGIDLLELIDYKPNISALDIGCGTGFPLLELAMRLGDQSTIYGIDPWEEGIKRIQKKIDFYNLKNVKLIEGQAEQIPLENNSIDLIVSNNGINNVQDIRKVFSECARVSKTGCQMVFSFNTNKTMLEFYATMREVFEENNMQSEIAKMLEHIKHKRPSLEFIASALKENNFIIKNLKFSQFNYKFSNANAFLNHHFIKTAFVPEWKKIIPPEKTEMIFEEIERKLEAQFNPLGKINLTIPYIIINSIKN